MLYKLAKKDDKAKRYANAAFGLSTLAFLFGYPRIKARETIAKSLERDLRKIYGENSFEFSEIRKSGPLGKAVKAIGLAAIPLGLYTAYRSYKNPDKKDADKYYRGAAAIGGLAGLTYLAAHNYNKEAKKALEELKTITDAEKLKVVVERFGKATALRELTRLTGHAAMGVAGTLALIGLANQSDVHKKNR